MFNTRFVMRNLLMNAFLWFCFVSLYDCLKATRDPQYKDIDASHIKCRPNWVSV